MASGSAHEKKLNLIVPPLRLLSKQHELSGAAYAAKSDEGVQMPSFLTFLTYATTSATGCSPAEI